MAGWTERYARARTDDVPDMERLAAWLASHLPPDRPGAVIHNDFKYDNVVLDPQALTTVRAVLDWEMATLGDPVADLGMTLAYWFEPGEVEMVGPAAFGPTALPGNLTREEIVQRYAVRSGRPVDDVVFQYVLGLFKVAVIAQQIYFRYRQGLTQDERFAGLGFAVSLLAQVAVAGRGPQPHQQAARLRPGVRPSHSPAAGPRIRPGARTGRAAPGGSAPRGISPPAASGAGSAATRGCPAARAGPASRRGAARGC